MDNAKAKDEHLAKIRNAQQELFKALAERLTIDHGSLAEAGRQLNICAKRVSRAVYGDGGMSLPTLLEYVSAAGYSLRIVDGNLSSTELGDVPHPIPTLATALHRASKASRKKTKTLSLFRPYTDKLERFAIEPLELSQHSLFLEIEDLLFVDKNEFRREMISLKDQLDREFAKRPRQAKLEQVNRERVRLLTAFLDLSSTFELKEGRHRNAASLVAFGLGNLPHRETSIQNLYLLEKGLAVLRRLESFDIAVALADQCLSLVLGTGDSTLISRYSLTAASINVDIANHRKATAFHRLTIDYAPHSKFALVAAANASTAAVRQGRFVEALEYLDAIETNPLLQPIHFTNLLWTRGRALIGLGQLEEGAGRILEAVRLAPDLQMAEDLLLMLAEAHSTRKVPGFIIAQELKRVSSVLMRAEQQNPKITRASLTLQAALMTEDYCSLELVRAALE